MIGAGAGSRKVAGVNCEVTSNTHTHTYPHDISTCSDTLQMMINARAPYNSDPGL